MSVVIYGSNYIRSAFGYFKVLYHVVHPRWMRPDIVKELLWRRHVYNNAIVSLRKLFKEESAKNRYEGASFYDTKPELIIIFRILMISN